MIFFRVITIALLVFFLSCTVNSKFVKPSIDDIYFKRIELINSIYKEKKKTILDQNFFQFRGIQAIISNPKFIDNLIGQCVDINKQEIYSFQEIFSEKEIRELKKQVLLFSKYTNIDNAYIDKSIKLENSNNKNNIIAITFPLMINDKAIIYQTDYSGYDILLVFKKINNKWVILCRKEFYNVVYD